MKSCTHAQSSSNCAAALALRVCIPAQAWPLRDSGPHLVYAVNADICVQSSMMLGKSSDEVVAFYEARARQPRPQFAVRG